MDKIHADVTAHIRDMMGDLLMQLAQARAVIEALQKELDARNEQG